MTAWTTAEQRTLAPNIDALLADLEPLAGKHVLVLCSAGGEVAFRAVRRGAAHVVGLELDDHLLASARRRRGGLPVRFE